jgi:NADH-quinone oxidoreductase subunit F
VNARSDDVPPADPVERLRISGLRGRGGGWFPTARKWQAVRVEGGEPYVVANGAEGEPGSVKDRFVMLTRPHAVLEGLVLAARTVGATEALVYLKGSFAAPAAALQAAIPSMAARGVAISVRRGEEGYVAGEETAILETLEGRRPWPRAKPPLPAGVGFHGRPTLVQNVETLARVPDALADPEGYRTHETTLVSLWGHVRRPGVHEVPLGTPLRRLIDERGGGTPDGVGMVFPAGPSAPPLSPGQLETPLDPDALREAGSGLGTAAVLVIGGSVCPLSVASSLARFFARESCGQCPPCTLGTTTLERVATAVDGGQGRGRDLEDLAEVAGFMSGHGYCAHSRTASASLTGLFRTFRDHVDAHLRAGSCPDGRPADPFGDGSPERTAIESALQDLAAAREPVPGP